MSMILSGSPGLSTIENSITDLVKALDNLCDAHKLTTQELRDRLDSDNLQKVEDVISKARAEIRSIVDENRQGGRLGQAEIVQEVLNRISDASSRSRQFGIAVRDLLKELGLRDQGLAPQQRKNKACAMRFRTGVIRRRNRCHVFYCAHRLRPAFHDFPAKRFIHDGVLREAVRHWCSAAEFPPFHERFPAVCCRETSGDRNQYQ